MQTKHIINTSMIKINWVEPFLKRFLPHSGTKSNADRQPGDRSKRDVLKLSGLCTYAGFISEHALHKWCLGRAFKAKHSK